MAGSRLRRIVLGQLPFGLAVAGAYGLILAPVLAVVVISVFAQEIVSFPPEGLTPPLVRQCLGESGIRPRLRHLAAGRLRRVGHRRAARHRGGPGHRPGRLRPAARRAGRAEHPAARPAGGAGRGAGTALYLFFVRAEILIDDDIRAPPCRADRGACAADHPLDGAAGRGLAAGAGPAAEEAAANLGARPFTVFRRVTLPMMRPAWWPPACSASSRVSRTWNSPCCWSARAGHPAGGDARTTWSSAWTRRLPPSPRCRSC